MKWNANSYVMAVTASYKHVTNNIDAVVWS